MSNPNKAIRAYDKKFDAWWAKVTEYLWGAGTLPDEPDAAQFDPHGCFDSGMTWQGFVKMADKKLHGIAKERRR